MKGEDIGALQIRMKKECHFSKGVRGKFYRPGVRLNVPIYLDDDIGEFVHKPERYEPASSTDLIQP